MNPSRVRLVGEQESLISNTLQPVTSLHVRVSNKNLNHVPGSRLGNGAGFVTMESGYMRIADLSQDLPRRPRIFTPGSLRQPTCPHADILPVLTWMSTHRVKPLQCTRTDPIKSRRTKTKRKSFKE